MNYTNIEAVIHAKTLENKIVGSDNIFKFGIELLDKHIALVLQNTEASFAQVSLVALAMHGFMLSHAGIKNTSLNTLDFSISGAGKSHNITMQSNMLLKGITQEQDNLQLLASDDEFPKKRFTNIHRGKITTPALYQCIQTVPAQLLIIDELGLLLQKDDDIILEVTKLYGATEASLPVLKTEAPTSKSIVPVALSFIGATTLSYFGSPAKLKYHISGGFINRAFIAYNKVLKTPEEILSIMPLYVDYESSNQNALELLYFAKNTPKIFDYNEASKAILLEFKREIQAIKIAFNSHGNDEYGLLYNRTFQNTQILINILHSLRCFEHRNNESVIDTNTVGTAISFVKTVVFTEIEKLINYLSDDELLQREEKHKAKIIKFVDEFFHLNNQMPKIRDVSQKTRLSRNEILDLTKDYLQVIPASTTFKYCTIVS